ncbi:TRAP transporter small permease [Thauera sp. CAU 1555]|uniref:TRAP transporter small permease protein n=1 Tax=Thauera sedimentorum TaxID=2767595 RepID=A0ABR9BDN7_9RHOO|nr:TRAP transporter small permease [Thauera sedimentorum]MBC9072638.1 TRAP transporter small permease [Thauera sedimentorum]MBD8503557.1 TRAP transporter small permease [Thauera sedimentorum]
MHYLRAALQAASDLLGRIALVCMAFLMLATTVDVSVRAITGKPISGIFELSELAMALIVFLGLGWTQLDDAHIRVTALSQLAPPRVRRLMDALSWSAAAAALFLLALPASEDAARAFAIREFRWGYIEFPIWWAKIALAAGLWFGTVQMAFAAISALVGQPSAVPSTDTPAGMTPEFRNHG